MTQRLPIDVSRLILRLDTTLAARVEEIDPLVDRVLELVRQMGCGEGQEFEIRTALQEALANAVVHGCERDSSKRVRVCVACDESCGILIVVRDPGPGFDPSRIPCPVIGENLFETHGRGIYLINQLMDEVEFTRGGAEIRMRKRGNGSSRAAVPDEDDSQPPSGS